MNAALQITNLLHIYAERIDAGDLESAAALFAKGRIKTGPDTGIVGTKAILELWRSIVRIYPCGTPRTRHVVTNPILHIDETAGTARCRSSFMVFQATEDLPLQPICAGRYLDQFVLDGREWRFAEREYSQLNLIGDVSRHLLVPVSLRA